MVKAERETMSKVIDAKNRFLSDDFNPDELLTMSYGALQETVEHTMQDILIMVLNEGDDAWLEFGQEVRSLYEQTKRN